jgi:chemotaxis protein histidine kinase CheA
MNVVADVVQRAAVELLNGTVDVDAGPGGGTCIAVDLPLPTRMNPRQ